MNISERILLYLNSVIEDNAFERLCNLILYNFGYRDINPIGGKHDRGRDAEIRYFRGESSNAQSTFFFFTRDQRSESKFKHDIEKVKKYDHDVSQIVVVTSQKITGATRKKWEDIAKTYNCEVRVHDQRWFVLQLTAHQEIAVTTGILDPSEAIEIASPRIVPSSLPVGTGHDCWKFFAAGEYESAIPEFKKLIQEDESDAGLWSATAWCHYQLHHYREALYAIRRSLELNPECEKSLSIKGCILAEQGIETQARPSLIEAKAIFSKLAVDDASWIEHYNLGNVLSALGEHEGARKAYERSLAYSPHEPMVWKNLGSIYAHLRNEDEEMRCYDEALKLDPNLTQALICKGIRLLSTEKKLAEGVELIEQALGIDEQVGIHWPHIWYWLGISFDEMGKIDEAIDVVERGLEIVPDYRALLNLKADILSKAWREDVARIDQARHYFTRLSEVAPDELRIKEELAAIALASGDSAPLHHLVNETIDTRFRSATEHLKSAEINLDQLGTGWLQYIPMYERYRSSSSPINELLKSLTLNGVRIDDQMVEQLVVQLATSFGIACDAVARLPASERSVEVLRAASSHCRDYVTRALRALVHGVAATLSAKDVDVLSEQLTVLIMHLPDLGLVEVSRQIGYISGKLNIPREVVDESMNDWTDITTWHAGLIQDILEWTNEIVKFAKE